MLENKVVYEGNLSKIYKLADNLYFREGNLELRDQCNSGFVVLNHSTAIIDYPSQNPAEEILEEAELVTGLPVKYFIITHAHCDHVTGFRTLKRKDIQLITRRTSIEELYKAGEPVPQIHTAVEKTMDLELDGYTFHLEVPNQTAHSPFDMLVGIKEHGIVFTGDMVALQKNMFFHSADIVGWRKSIDELMNENWNYIARGHGSIVTADYLKDAARYLELLDNARKWQEIHNEEVNPETVEYAFENLSPELAQIVSKLTKVVDPRNAARQINQLFYKIR